ncbi:uncharacterized protein LOC127359674 [Dicentrarchus labrax]|uniref:uncharacterized protein LOC127359674 n=1 Tax=Dicentrarchus labrax TaxID=13489 RepID=UPI0021F62A25|nr:uncharacterized protein LOC127359674 [Dicentrarchus labrax]
MATVNVRIPDSVLENIAKSLQNSEPIRLDVPKINTIVNGVLNVLGLPKGPVELQLTDKPTISISESGVSVRVNAKAQSLVESRTPALPVMCKVAMKVDILGRRLILLSQTSECKVRPQTTKGKFAKLVVNFVLERYVLHKVGTYIQSWFNDGVLLPLPKEVDFTHGHIEYHKHFLVVSGSLNLSEAGKEKVRKQTAKINNIIKKKAAMKTKRKAKKEKKKHKVSV